jgi:hypothetical protein
MEPLEEYLSNAGYAVVNQAYPSREHTIESLALDTVPAAVKACGADVPIHFVTHSLGGILVRYYTSNHTIPNLGRVVMLAPPNQGSEVVDNWRDVPGFEFLNGPAGLQLGTDADSLPRTLGPVDFPLGVIAGTSTFNPILSRSLPNPDDGKVSVAATRVEGMQAFIEVDHSHPFIMRPKAVHELVLAFLRTGRFQQPEQDQLQPRLQ